MRRRSKPSIRRVSVLGSGKVSEKDPAYRQAVKLGRALAQEKLIIFHGGHRGVMDAAARGCRLAGGRNIGVTIKSLSAPTPGVGKAVNLWTDVETRMPSWESRLFKLIEMGDAYIFLDGASGTLAELFVVLEMTNRGLLSKPIIILGRKLGALLRSLAKDPHFDLPVQLVFVTSVEQAIRHLRA